VGAVEDRRQVRGWVKARGLRWVTAPDPGVAQGLACRGAGGRCWWAIQAASLTSQSVGHDALPHARTDQDVDQLDPAQQLRPPLPPPPRRRTRPH